MIQRISMRRGVPGFTLALMILAADASLVQAQQPPPGVDAGALQNRTNRLRRDLENRVAPGASDDAGAVTGPARAAAPLVPGGGPTFVLKRVEFNESYFFKPQELAAIAAPFVGRKLDFAGIQAIVNAVNARYAERGIVTASASLPEQDLDGGVLRIELVEGRVGKVTMEGASTSADYIRGRARLQPGEVVDVPALGARMAAQNRIGEARVRTALQPGTDFGQTDVTLSVTEPKSDLLDVFVDNLGSPTTGRFQRGMLFQHYGLLGLDDRFKFYGVNSEGNLSGNLSYTFGITPTGGRLGLSYSASRIKIIDGAFEDLNVTGGSQAGGINFVQPLFSDSEWLVLLNVGATLTHSTTDQDGVPFTDNLTFKPMIGATLNYYAPNLAVSFSPSYSFGTTDIRVTDSSDQAHFFNGTMSVTAVLPQEVVFQGFGAWQVASKPLVTGDQLFQIGGATTVRGYGGNTVAGGSGYYANFELHKSFTGDVGTFDFFTFLDHGAVYSTSPKKVSLTGIGTGMSYSFDNRLTLELTLGFPVGDHVPDSPSYTLFARLIGRVF
ncbi:ShlB/FhaC/HecB family hemolysin secretion/activation protein [Rhizobium terrae]|uniref:ShlB/FhaC/HecB family hemolysin secretion/activation protein n=1 Tax=Rhizobium terrae TaxID=2171756 RepID=UPI0013C36FD4|nr:ShlB/FhaC/HecB family hemolysin secretion/activation protein [Rhizobium terrae]